MAADLLRAAHSAAGARRRLGRRYGRVALWRVSPVTGTRRSTDCLSSVRQPTGHRFVRLRQASAPPRSKSRLSVVAKLKHRCELHGLTNANGGGHLARRWMAGGLTIGANMTTTGFLGPPPD